MIKNLFAMQEIWVQSLGRDDPLEEGTATHSSVLACKMPRTEEPGELHRICRAAKSQTWLKGQHTHTQPCVVSESMVKFFSVSN